jgi:ribosomal protein L7/L12
MSDSDREIQDIKTRLEKLETRMSFLFRSLGIMSEEAPTRGASLRVIELVRQGDTLGAIKAFREETGASLKDAKTYVESLEP